MFALWVEEVVLCVCVCVCVEGGGREGGGGEGMQNLTLNSDAAPITNICSSLIFKKKIRKKYLKCLL